MVASSYPVRCTLCADSASSAVGNSLSFSSRSLAAHTMSRPWRCRIGCPNQWGATGHDDAMRRGLMAAAGLALLSCLGMTGRVSAATAPSPVTTVVSGLRTPGQLSFDSAGDLFVADTGHCRVLMVPSHSGTVLGRQVRALRSYVVAGSR